jgi:hypothetical protein
MPVRQMFFDEKMWKRKQLSVFWLKSIRLNQTFVQHALGRMLLGKNQLLMRRHLEAGIQLKCHLVSTSYCQHFTTTTPCHFIECQSIWQSDFQQNVFQQKSLAPEILEGRECPLSKSWKWDIKITMQMALRHY